MKIGIVSEWFERGSSYVTLQYRGVLEKQGHEVFIYARSENTFLGENLWSGKSVYVGKFRSMPFGKPIDKKDFIKWLAQNRIEAVIFNEQIWPLPVLWARKQNVLTIAYVDYYTKKSLNDFSVYDLLICNSKQHYEAFKWHPNAVYIPWGTDLEFFNQKPRNSRTVTFFHSSGWSPYRKGTDLVIKAFCEMNSQAKLIIHTQRNLTDFLGENGIDTLNPKFSDIEFIEGSFPPPGLYHLGDVYVYPSRLDGIGLTQAEALACGLPIIVPNVEPMRTFGNHGYSITCPVSKKWTREDDYYWPLSEIDFNSLCSSMKYFADNQELVDAWRSESRKWAEEHLDWSKNSARIGIIISNANRLKFQNIRLIRFKIKHFDIFEVWRLVGFLWRLKMKILTKVSSRSEV